MPVLVSVARHDSVDDYTETFISTVVVIRDLSRATRLTAVCGTTNSFGTMSVLAGQALRLGRMPLNSPLGRSHSIWPGVCRAMVFRCIVYEMLSLRNKDWVNAEYVRAVMASSGLRIRELSLCFRD